MSFYQVEKKPLSAEYDRKKKFVCDSSSLHVVSLHEASSGLLLFPVECYGLTCCRDLCKVSCMSLQKTCGRISSPLRLVTVKSPFALATGFSLTVCVLLPLSGFPGLHSRMFSVPSKFICSGGETVLDPEGSSRTFLPAAQPQPFKVTQHTVTVNKTDPPTPVIFKDLCTNL